MTIPTLPSGYRYYIIKKVAILNNLREEFPTLQCTWLTRGAWYATFPPVLWHHDGSRVKLSVSQWHLHVDKSWKLGFILHDASYTVDNLLFYNACDWKAAFQSISSASLCDCQWRFCGPFLFFEHNLKSSGSYRIRIYVQWLLSTESILNLLLETGRSPI